MRTKTVINNLKIVWQGRSWSVIAPSGGVLATFKDEAEAIKYAQQNTLYSVLQAPLVREKPLKSFIFWLITPIKNMPSWKVLGGLALIILIGFLLLNINNVLLVIVSIGKLYILMFTLISIPLVILAFAISSIGCFLGMFLFMPILGFAFVGLLASPIVVVSVILSGIIGIAGFTLVGSIAFSILWLAIFGFTTKILQQAVV